MPIQRTRLGSLIGYIFLGLFMVAAGGAAPRYNRILFGALPLALALIAFGVAYATKPTMRSRSLSPAVALWLCAAVVIAVWVRPSLAGAEKPDPHVERSHVLLTFERDRLREALFTELQPVKLRNCEIERFGDDKSDGGYLMCGNLLGGGRAAYSYGIEGRDQWGCEVSSRISVPLHEYDCFDLRRPVCSTGNTNFHPECVGPTRHVDEESSVFDSVNNQLTRNGDAANHVIIKMDIEGAEWDTLAQTPDDVLERTDQLVMELHGIGTAQQLAVIQRLKRFFHIAHLHFNNNTCTERIDPFPAWAYEVLLVNKRLAAAEGSRAPAPHPLDAPNNPTLADCQLPTNRWSHVLPGLVRGDHR